MLIASTYLNILCGRDIQTIISHSTKIVTDSISDISLFHFIRRELTYIENKSHYREYKTYGIFDINNYIMDHRITFDLNLLELALEKAIESLQIESNLLNKMNIASQDLDRVAGDKEDIMNFIEWHIPIIIRYIKMHKGDLDDLDDLSNLAIKSQAINKTAQAAIQPKMNNNIVIGSQKVSTITIMATENHQKPLLDAIFKNDSPEMPKKLTKLLKQMLFALESNFNKLIARKRLNDQIFNLVSQTVKEDQKVSYSPKRKKENIQGNLIYNEDC